MSYKHLSLESLNRSESTLSRELSRNMSQRGYRHVYANKKAIIRHTDKPKAIKMTDDIKMHLSLEFRA